MLEYIKYLFNNPRNVLGNWNNVKIDKLLQSIVFLVKIEGRMQIHSNIKTE